MDANILGSIGQGVAQGLERGTQNAYNIQNQGMNQRLQIQKMAEDQQYKQQMLSMSQSQHAVQMEQMQLQIEGLKQAKLKETTYNAINGYLTDGNPRWLNGALQENPELQKLFGGVTRIEPLNNNSQDDVKMFEAAGGINMDDPSVRKRYVKAIDSSGNISLVDTFGLAQKTGAFKQWNDEQLKMRLTEAQIAEHNAKAIKYASGGDDTDTAMQKNYNFLNRRDPKLGEDYLKKETGWAPTSQTKEGLELEKVKKELPTDFFDKTYVPGTPEYRELEPKVQKIEKLAGIKLDSATRKEISNLKQIITLADPAAKLTDADTGLIDNTFGNIGKYISDKSPAEAKSAYNQIMTSIRNATYGATLPAAEMSAFANAYGTLYQQTPAIRDSLRTALKGVQAKLDAYAYVGDEAVSHFRFGADEKKLNGIIDNLQGLIDATEAKEPGKKAIKPNIPLPNKTAADGASDDYKTPPPAPRNSVKEYTDGTRAKNPQTGEVLVYRTGKGWVAE